MNDDSEKDLLHEAILADVSKNPKSQLAEKVPSLREIAKNIKEDTIYNRLIPIEPPDNNKEQIKKISEQLQRYKRFKKLTLDEVIKSLPVKYRYSRTAINAYLHGTVKTPPDRDFLIALFKALNLNDTELNHTLKICGYSGLEKDHIKDLSRDLIVETCHKLNKGITDDQIEQLSDYISSFVELTIKKRINSEQ